MLYISFHKEEEIVSRILICCLYQFFLTCLEKFQKYSRNYIHSWIIQGYSSHHSLFTLQSQFQPIYTYIQVLFYLHQV
ncbi:hypothetical protein Hanom_Chr07g00614151 [Helianthus anomalus]